MKKIIISTVMVFSVTSSWALNMGEVRKEIRYKIIDTTETVNSPRWSDKIINEMINNSQNRIALFTDCCYSRWTIDTSTGIQEYDKPADMYKIDMVRYMQNSSTYSYKRIDYKDFAALDRDVSTSWISYSSGMPTYYYERGAKIGLQPKPGLTYAQVNALMVEGYKMPAAMDDDTDIPWDTDYSLIPFHSLIVLDVSSEIRDSEGYNVSDKKSEFWAMIDYMRRWVKSRNDRNAVINFNFGK